jgi:glutaminyl-peptide cyclotransferase
MIKRMNLFFIIACFLMSCGGNKNNSTTTSTPPRKNVPKIEYQVIRSYPHDVTAFTEGFLFNNGQLYESTGAPEDMPQTRSLFGVVDLATGKIDVKAEIDRKKYFGEGISILNGKVYQLTYQTKKGFVYDATTFKQLSEFSFSNNEGWGMTTDGTNLIMSDGTNQLTYLNPSTLQVVKTLSVTENGYAKDYVNELEYVDGFVYANIWPSNVIVKINLADGTVVGSADMSALANEARAINPNSCEMNGIAYNPATGTFLLTGKMWPKIYEVSFGK